MRFPFLPFTSKRQTPVASPAGQSNRRSSGFHNSRFVALACSAALFLSASRYLTQGGLTFALILMASKEYSLYVRNICQSQRSLAKDKPLFPETFGGCLA